MSKRTTSEKLALKYYWMNVAHVIDVFRLIPRLLVSGYGYLVWDSVQWFQTLPDPTNSHTFLISTIVGGAAAVFGLYVNSGASWTDQKSARKELYIESNADGSSFNNGPQFTELPQRPEYRQPLHHRRGAPNNHETPPPNFLDVTRN